VAYFIHLHKPAIAIESLHEANEQGLKRIAAVKEATTKNISVQSEDISPSLSQTPVNKAISSAFITTSGTNLALNGSTFRSIGVNRYNLLTLGGTPYIGCGGMFSETQLSTWFSELNNMGVTSVRFWLFQSFTKSGKDFKRFNYVLQLASQNGIKVIPVFENQWKDCTEGGYKETAWYQDGYKHPYGTYELSYRDYVMKVVGRYKNNPTIFMWQLINEAEADYDELFAFTTDMGNVIKSNDPNHLLSLGTIGSGQKGAQGGQYRSLHAISSIDVAEFHDYPKNSGVENSTYLAARLADAKSLGKPLFVGESGIKSGCSDSDCFTYEKRASLLDTKLQSFFENGGAAYLFWSYRDTNHQNYDGFDIEANDPVISVIKQHASKL
jgi:endo-1,4-beta-mannosidase